MIKRFFLLSLLSGAFLTAMENNYRNIKPDSLAPRLIALARAYDESPLAIATYEKFYVTPGIITQLSPETSNAEDAERYVAHVEPGQTIFCTYYRSGPYAHEIWAHITRLASTIFTLPIPQENFFILKGLCQNKQITDAVIKEK